MVNVLKFRTLYSILFVPRLFEEKRRDTVFGFPWCQKIRISVLSPSFWNFTGALRMVWRYACGLFRILKLFFITGFLLQYLGKWYRTNGHLVNLAIFNTSNKNKAGGHKFPTEFACLALILLFTQLFLEMLSGMTNSVDPDQTVPSGAVWSGAALFAYGILSETLVFEILGHLP